MSEEPEAKKKKVEEPQQEAGIAASGNEDKRSQTKDLLKQKFLVDMPQDFYNFWDLLKTINAENPSDVLHPFGLSLAGPYDVLLGKSSTDDKDYLIHHRFFYDLPEFQTVLISTKKDSKYHIGYYRDSPNEDPVFLASNDGTECKLNIISDNILAAVHHNLQQDRHKTKGKLLREKIESVMEEKGYEFGKQTKKIKVRSKKIVSRGFHGAGIVVPVDENEVGWREVPQTIGELKRMFKSIVSKDKNSAKSADDLQELITYVQFANDECDYGQGLELGNDLFCYGEESLHGYVKSLMPMAYMLLGYSAFEQIILAHLDKRNKDSVSCLS